MGIFPDGGLCFTVLVLRLDDYILQRVFPMFQPNTDFYSSVLTGHNSHRELSKTNNLSHKHWGPWETELS